MTASILYKSPLECHKPRMFVKKRKREFGVLHQIKFQGWHFLDLSGAGAPSPSGFSSSFF